MEIKAITLWQPWASLVVAGHKRFETRSWNTDFRCVLAIHAGMMVGGWHGMGGAALRLAIGLLGPMDKLPRGAVLGTVRLDAVDSVLSPWIVEALTPQERLFGDFSLGRFAWRLAAPVKLDKPIPARGRQGLWNWTIPAELIPLINQQGE